MHILTIMSNRQIRGRRKETRKLVSNANTEQSNKPLINTKQNANTNKELEQPITQIRKTNDKVNSETPVMI